MGWGEGNGCNGKQGVSLSIRESTRGQNVIIKLIIYKCRSGIIGKSEGQKRETTLRVISPLGSGPRSFPVYIRREQRRGRWSGESEAKTRIRIVGSFGLALTSAVISFRVVGSVCFPSLLAACFVCSRFALTGFKGFLLLICVLFHLTHRCSLLCLFLYLFV